MSYVELNIDFIEVDPWREILICELAGKGAESFVETKSGCQAYFKKDVFPGVKNLYLNHLESRIKSISERIIEDQNWNAAWEENFEPVFVSTDLAILAPFHNQSTSHKFKVLIQPQMSFGTGHHQTTWLMSHRLMSMDLKGLKVLDMGTGTGVLAILSEKLGAASVFATDIDQWAYDNALENATLNDCKIINWALGGVELLTNTKFDLIIANINKNTLLEQFRNFSECSINGATLLLSGFFTTDINELVLEASKFGFIFENKYNKDEWALIEMIKN